MPRGNESAAPGADDDEVASSYASSRSYSQEVAATQSGEDSYEDDLDDYSDEFEDEINDEAIISCGAEVTSNEQLFLVGDRVQVFWDEEKEWFDGSVAQADAHRCFVHYVDGEEQWEPVEIIRLAPSSTIDFTQQLQLVVDTPRALKHVRVAVYWHAERSWFEGCIVDTTTSAGKVQSIHIIYDDGDRQWIARAGFVDVLLAVSHELVQPTYTSLDKSESMEKVTERYLSPRKYTPALATHFEPVRTPRPYHCSIRNHVGSIITPRYAAKERRSFECRADIKLDIQVTSTDARSHIDGKAATRDCEIQTDIDLLPTVSA